MTEPIIEVLELGVPWQTCDPFLFCVHHQDAYPQGDGKLAPLADLKGRRLGQDFEGRDGWNMYHGRKIPGFPAHPHRGFETVTIGRRGLIDHSDSLGAKARFGRGDVQWLTAGAGIVHSEMFPLVHEDKGNPLELFQIWLNLPRQSKMVKPYFTMFWNDDVPEHDVVDAAGRHVRVRTIAGRLGEEVLPAPPPDSWASAPDSQVAIWTISLEPGAEFNLPPCGPSVNRVLYFFAGDSLTVGSVKVERHCGVRVQTEVELRLTAGAAPVQVLMLQGRPIGEPVVSYGPFVMNTREEIQRAVRDYQDTAFGGWPWESEAPVHEERPRFASHADGRNELPAAQEPA